MKNEAAIKTWMGKQVTQHAAAHPEYQKFVGRVGTVIEVMVDETDHVHCQTGEDGVWCPSRYLTILEKSHE